MALLALGGCRTSRVFVPDVVDSFGTELALVELRTPQRIALDPTRAANADRAMRRTLKLAERYLARNEDGVNARFVRALAACCELIQGQPVAARDRMRGIQPLSIDKLSRENAFITATAHAVGAARSLEAFTAVEQMLDETMPIERFVLDWGSFAGIVLPNKDAEGYEFYRDRAIEEVRRNCFEVEEKYRERNRSLLRGAIAEQIYNESAAMLVVMQESSEPPERWLTHVVLGLFVGYAKLMPDLLPADLSEEQKQWQREQAFGAYNRCKRLARNLLSKEELEKISDSPAWKPTPNQQDAHRQLYAQLLDAEIVVMGYISTR